MKNKFMRSSCFFLVVVGALLSFGACRNCPNDMKTTTDTRANIQASEQVSACDNFNNEREKCNKASLSGSGEACHFDEVTKNCVIKTNPAEVPCDKLSMEQCKQSKTCTYQDALGRCTGADPALAGRCEVIQAQPACDADALCQWDGMAMVCKDKINELP